MSSSSFPYNWDNVIHVIRKKYSIIHFKDPKYDLYTMDNISQSLIHFSKGNFKCVLKCTKFPKKSNGYMSRTNLVLVLTKKRGRKSSHDQFSTQTD